MNNLIAIEGSTHNLNSSFEPLFPLRPVFLLVDNALQFNITLIEHKPCKKCNILYITKIRDNNMILWRTRNLFSHSKRVKFKNVLLNSSRNPYFNLPLALWQLNPIWRQKYHRYLLRRFAQKRCTGTKHWPLDWARFVHEVGSSHIMGTKCCVVQFY